MSNHYTMINVRWLLCIKFEKLKMFSILCIGKKRNKIHLILSFKIKISISFSIRDDIMIKYVKVFYEFARYY